MNATVTDRDKLATQVEATIEWNFGQICDEITNFSEACKEHSRVKCIDCFKRIVRRHGNESIRVIKNHLDWYQITLRLEKQPINKRRVVRQALEKG